MTITSREGLELMMSAGSLSAVLGGPDSSEAQLQPQVMTAGLQVQHQHQQQQQQQQHQQQQQQQQQALLPEPVMAAAERAPSAEGVMAISGPSNVLDGLPQLLTAVTPDMELPAMSELMAHHANGSAFETDCSLHSGGGASSPTLEVLEFMPVSPNTFQ